MLWSFEFVCADKLENQWRGLNFPDLYKITLIMYKNILTYAAKPNEFFERNF